MRERIDFTIAVIVSKLKVIRLLHVYPGYITSLVLVVDSANTVLFEVVIHMSKDLCKVQFVNLFYHFIGKTSQPGPYLVRGKIGGFGRFRGCGAVLLFLLSAELLVNALQVIILQALMLGVT